MTLDALGFVTEIVDSGQTPPSGQTGETTQLAAARGFAAAVIDGDLALAQSFESASYAWSTTGFDTNYEDGTGPYPDVDLISCTLDEYGATRPQVISIVRLRKLPGSTVSLFGSIVVVPLQPIGASVASTMRASIVTR